MIHFSSNAPTISDAMDQISTIVTACLGWIQNNLILFTCFCAGLIPIGFMVIRRAKKTSRS